MWWVLVGLLAVVCALGGVQVAQARDDRARADVQHARYADSLAAATAEAEAFVNLDHRTAEEDLARIAAGATGAFEQRYTEGVDALVRRLRRDRLVTEGKVLWAGVVHVDASGASVLVATTGTRSDRTTTEPVARDLRLRMELVPVDGEWLTAGIEQVE